MKNNKRHTKEAIKKYGEVFTPTILVKQMLDKIPPEVFKHKEKTFLDPSCGNGQFLVEVLARKIANGISHRDALVTIYGVEIQDHNAEKCRVRLLMGSKDEELRRIVDNNIICADALDKDHMGWKKVGYMWTCPKFFGVTDKERKEDEEVQRRSLETRVSAISFGKGDKVYNLDNLQCSLKNILLKVKNEFAVDLFDDWSMDNGYLQGDKRKELGLIYTVNIGSKFRFTSIEKE